MTIQQQALNYYGIDEQLVKLAEECGELTQAAIKYRAGKTDVRKLALASEAADVEILIEQIRLYLGDAQVDSARAEKLTRLERRLKLAGEIPPITFKGKKGAKKIMIGSEPYPSLSQAAEAPGLRPHSLTYKLEKGKGECVINGVVIKEIPA